MILYCSEKCRKKVINNFDKEPRKCKVCGKKHVSRFINICYSCQYKHKYCIVCGVEIKKEDNDNKELL